MSPLLSIYFRFGLFIVALYICIVGLFSTTNNSPNNKGVGIHYNQPSRNVVLMVIDAMRADMVMSPSFSKNWPFLHSMISKGIVECSTAKLSSPTVTSPRIKAIATGRIPEFLDIIYNMETAVVTQDSWVRRLADAARNVEMYGDITWLNLFPNAFSRTDGTSSFFVNDFYEVDKNVSRNLDGRLSSLSEWTLMILHYLGLDHIGHVEGPYGRSMPNKMQEMDNVISTIVNKLEASGRNDWVLIVTGDHGMTNLGSHGGSSFVETNTPLLILSPLFLNSSPESFQPCSVHQNIFIDPTDQTDVATIIGLLTGVGIPSGSIGLPNTRMLQAFWPDPVNRLTTLSILLEHLSDLAGCNQKMSHCSSDLLITNEVNTLRHLNADIKALREVCTTPSASNQCNLLDTDANRIAQLAVNLVRRFQQRILLNSTHCNMFLVSLACFAMWLISMSFLFPAIMDIFQERSLLHVGVASKKTYSMMVQLLACFSVLLLLLHCLSLTSSSLIEEEHQTWYFFITSLLIFLSIIMSIADYCNEGLKSRGKRIGALFLIMSVDRFVLRYLNPTGDRWADVPYLSAWFEEHAALWFIVQYILWLFLIFVVRFVLCLPAPRFRKHHYFTVASLSFVAVIQIYHHSTNSDHRRSGTLSVVPARMAYIFIAIDLFAMIWFGNRLAKWTNALDSEADHSDDSPIVTSGGNPIVSPVHTIALVAMLLGKPTGTVLWVCVILKEVLFCRIFHNELVACSKCSNDLQVKLKYCIAILYWMLGWSTFFQQGNSNKFSTIDLASGYVGLEQHSNILSCFLTISYTFAGPIFWQMSLFYRMLSGSFAKAGLSSYLIQKRKQKYISFSVGLLTVATSMSATICLILNTHLFIWSVFAPKLFYMAALSITFIPLFIFMNFI